MTIAARIVKTYLASSQNSFDPSLSHLLNLWDDNDADGFENYEDSSEVTTDSQHLFGHICDNDDDDDDDDDFAHDTNCDDEAEFSLQQ